MSYLVLARKARPQTFDEVVGQRPVVKTLQNSIRRDRIAHAILFSGVRGVGKTTLARIMAKAINCSSPGDQRPCNKCTSCREITSGASLDLYEIDGASNRGIQEIRELKEKIRFLPTSAPFKVIIIDEVHMLTTEAFNALLKTLEEPPAHVHFMFATTEIHKIPITILSRCQQYELKRISAKELYDHFEKLAAAEGFAIEPPALSLIVREAAGSVRDGLSLLDQMFSFGDKTISASDVAEVLGLVDRDVLLTLTRGLLEGDKAAVFTTLQSVFGFGMDIKRFTEDLLGQFRNLLLCKIDGCTELLDMPAEDLVSLQEVASSYSSETIHLKLTLLMQMSENLKNSTQPRITLETSFLRIIEASNVVPLSSLLGHLEEIMPHLPSSGTAQETAAPSTAQDSKKKITPDRQAVVKSNLTAEPEPPPVHPSRTPPPKAVTDTTKEKYKPVAPPPTPDIIPEDIPLPPEPGSDTPSPSRPQQSSPGNPGKWDGFVDFVKEKSIWIATNLQRADSIDLNENTINLNYSEGINCTLLRQKENHQLLGEYASDYFKKTMTITFTVPEIDNSLDENGEESPQKKRQQLANDPLVLMASEVFNGQIGEIRLSRKKQ